MLIILADFASVDRDVTYFHKTFFHMRGIFAGFGREIFWYTKFVISSDLFCSSFEYNVGCLGC